MARVKHMHQSMGDKANDGFNLLHKYKALRALINKLTGRLEFIETHLGVNNEAQPAQEITEADVTATKIKKIKKPLSQKSKSKVKR